MKKMIFIGVVLIITVLYVVVGAVLFIDIQVLQAPETTITLNVFEINENEAVVHTNIQVKNPNSFDLITRDFELTLLTETGVDVGHATISGGIIPPNDMKNFSTTLSIGFNQENPGMLQTRVSGVVGLNVFGVFEKTIPLAITLITPIDEILEQIQAPTIRISADFSDISDTGVNITGLFDVYNPNAFDLFIEDFSADMKNESGESVGLILVHGGVLHEKQSTVLTGEGQIRIEALNAKTITMKIPVHAGVRMIGFNKSLTIDVETQFTMPDFNRLLSYDRPLDLVIKGDYKITRAGVLVNVTLEIYNPHNFTLIAKDLSVTIYEVKNDEEKKIGYGTIEDGVVTPRGSVQLNGDVQLPPSQMITVIRGLLSSDWLKTTVRGNLTIPGLEKNLWVGITGYEDLHPFR